MLINQEEWDSLLSRVMEIKTIWVMELKTGTIKSLLRSGWDVDSTQSENLSWGAGIQKFLRPTKKSHFPNEKKENLLNLTRFQEKLAACRIVVAAHLSWAHFATPHLLLH